MDTSDAGAWLFVYEVQTSNSYIISSLLILLNTEISSWG